MCMSYKLPGRSRTFPNSYQPSRSTQKEQPAGLDPTNTQHFLYFIHTRSWMDFQWVRISTRSNISRAETSGGEKQICSWKSRLISQNDRVVPHTQDHSSLRFQLLSFWARLRARANACSDEPCKCVFQPHRQQRGASKSSTAQGRNACNFSLLPPASGSQKGAHLQPGLLNILHFTHRG